MRSSAPPLEDRYGIPLPGPMTRALFRFVRFNTENRTIEQKSTEIQPEIAVGPSTIQMPVFGCSSRCHPRNHSFRSILNRRAQRQIFKQKISAQHSRNHRRRSYRRVGVWACRRKRRGKASVAREESSRKCAKFNDSRTRLFPDCAGKKRFSFREQLSHWLTVQKHKSCRQK